MEDLSKIPLEELAKKQTQIQHILDNQGDNSQETSEKLHRVHPNWAAVLSYVPKSRQTSTVVEAPVAAASQKIAKPKAKRGRPFGRKNKCDVESKKELKPPLPDAPPPYDEPAGQSKKVEGESIAQEQTVEEYECIKISMPEKPETFKKTEGKEDKERFFFPGGFEPVYGEQVKVGKGVVTELKGVYGQVFLAKIQYFVCKQKGTCIKVKESRKWDNYACINCPKREI